jgi:hypothetical protein
VNGPAVRVAKGLEQDRDAVTQGLTSRWNSGPVEGRVNHIKMVKRQMFGRAGLPLLRKRVLLTAASQPPGAATSAVVGVLQHNGHHTSAGCRDRRELGVVQIEPDTFLEFVHWIILPRP